MLKSFVFTHCAVESRSNNPYFKRWFILCRLVMGQVENAVTAVLALDIDSGFLCNGRPCTCPLRAKQNLTGIRRGRPSDRRDSFRQRKDLFD